MITNLGMVKPGSTLRIPFDTFAAGTGAPTALSNFAVGDILIYKDGNTTARASTTGYTATTTFSSVTGLNEIVIDLSSDATGDFFKSGSKYTVAVSPVTADSQTLSFWAAIFEIGYTDAVLNTSIATLSSQTSFTLTAGPAEDDALNGLWCLVHDKASAVQASWAVILDYTGSTKTVTLAATPALTFTAAAIDNIAIFGPMPLQPTVIGRYLDVSTGGEAGLDWANIGSPTTAQNLSATNIDVDQIVASVSGAVGSVTGLTAADVGAIKTKTDFLPSATAGANGGLFIAGTNAATTITTALTTTFTGNLTGSVGSVATGGIAAASFAAGAIDNSAIAADAIGASELATSAVTEIANGAWDQADGVEVGLTPRQSMKIQSAAAAGELSGAATTTVVIRNAQADSKDRITATVDADGNRSAVTLDLT